MSKSQVTTFPRFSIAAQTVRIILTVALARVITACPVCHTQVGQQVRAGLFDGSFVSLLLLVICPFPILVIAVKYCLALIPLHSDEVDS